MTYTPDEGRIVAPSTIPQSILRALADRFAEGGPVGIWSNGRWLEEIAPHMFRDVIPFELMIAQPLPGGGWTYVDVPRIPLMMVAVADYRDNYAAA